ncbi:MAG: DedA family protein [Candidatus Zixiibacteriota bacterium]|nr:MAG: DedA family protein [candidate division Zixibacteria bacterium]
MGEDPARINQLLDLIFSYGPFWVYLAIFAACFIENIFPPFPGDSFIAAAGALVAVARLELTLTFIIIVFAGVASVMVVYAVGKRYGRDFFIRKNYRYFSAADIARVEEHFHRWGALILVGSRFVVGLRSVLALVAGISRYDNLRMLVFSTISYLLFVGLIMYGAMTLVENLDVLKEYFRTYNLIVWPILIIAIAYYILRKFRSLKKGGK